MKIFVPGRICLFGEHSDWAGGYRRINADIEKGYTLICGTDQGIYAEVEPHPTSLVLTSTTPDGERHGPYEIPMEPKALLEEAEQGRLLELYGGRGLSGPDQLSGARPGHSQLQDGSADEEGPVVQRGDLRADGARLQPRLRSQADRARRDGTGLQGEITTPSRCGRMDQGCAFGNRPVLMTFDGDRLDTEELQVSKELYFVIVDLQAKKDTMEILNRLNRCYPDRRERDRARRAGTARPDQQAHRAPGDRSAAARATRERLGALMVEAQAFFDRYATPACPKN